MIIFISFYHSIQPTKATTVMLIMHLFLFGYYSTRRFHQDSPLFLKTLSVMMHLTGSLPLFRSECAFYFFSLALRNKIN